MDPFVNYHILKRAKELNASIPQNYLESLKSVESINIQNGYKVRFSFFKDDFQKVLSASAIFKNYILLSPEWAAIYTLYNNDDTKNAIRITIGHELTHKIKDFSKLVVFGKDKIFINWVNEIHADFGGAEKMANSSRLALIKSYDYKINYKINQHKKDIDKSSNPSFKTRKYYVENYNFNKKLIKKVALNTGCLNDQLINQIISYYDEIILN